MHIFIDRLVIVIKRRFLIVQILNANNRKSHYSPIRRLKSTPVE